MNQRGNMYYANFTLKGKRCRVKLASDMDTALLRLNELKVEMLTLPSGITSNNKRMDYIGACNLFMVSAYKVENGWSIPYNKKLSQAMHMIRTLKKYQEHSGVEYVDQVTYATLQSFLDRLAMTVANNSMIQYRAMLIRFFGYCQNNEWIIKSPANKLPKYKKTVPHRHFFTGNELDSIMANAGEFKPFYQFMLYTGVRCTDLWEMKRDVFYEEDGRTFLKIKMKKTKTTLNIPLSDEAVAILPTLGEDYLFPGSDQRGWHLRQLRNLRRNFSYDDYRNLNICNHTFRHTFAMNHLIKGTPKNVIQQLMGHSSIVQTEVYSNYLPPVNLLDYV